MTLPVSLVVVLLVSAVGAAIAITLFLVRRREARPDNSVRTAAAPQSVVRYSEPVESPAPPPRKKLFLSYAAVVNALRTNVVTDEDLAQCLFVTSDTEIELGREYNEAWYDHVMPFLLTAVREGRLIKDSTERRLNATTYAQVNELLARNGVGLLTTAESMVATSYLDDIPMFSCVPRVSDNSLEVLWHGQKLPADWKRCFDPAPELVELSAGELASRKAVLLAPPAPKADWLTEMNRDVMEHARRRHELPQPPAKPADADQTEETGEIDFGNAYSDGRDGSDVDGDDDDEK